MLKKLVITSSAIFGLHVFCNAQENFKYDISGIIPGAQKILLASDMYGSNILDSTTNTNGTFNFDGIAPSVSLGSLIVEKKDKLFPDYYNVFIEPGRIKVKSYPSGTQVDIRGSKNNNIVSTVESANQEFWTKAPPMYDSINFASMTLSRLHRADVVNNDSIQYYQSIQKRIEEAVIPYITDRNKKLITAFRKYPQSFFTAYYALNSFQLPADTLKKMYAKFDEKLKNSSIGKEWHHRLFEVNHLMSGTRAPEFSAKDADGKTIILADYKGKYVLLDFWATWCMPCRAGNPHLIELYKKYKDQGIEFVGISDDDQNIKGWKKAIKNDGIDIWPQILRGRDTKTDKGESSDLSKKYLVDGYPTKILIDKDGNIIGIYSNESELDAELKSIFGS